MINQKVAKIHPDLDAIRNLFNVKLSQKLGVNQFPKNKSDQILANSIKQCGLMDFNVIKKGRKPLDAFDIKWW